MNEQNQTQTKRKSQVLFVARIVTSIVAAFYLLAFGPKLVGSYLELLKGKPWSVGSWEGVTMELTFWIFLAGFILSWKRPCTGGIILIIGSLVQMLPFIIIDANFGSLIFGLPLLISGILLVAGCKDAAEMNR